MRTMVSICGKDRRALVTRCLESVAVALEVYRKQRAFHPGNSYSADLFFHVDPMNTEIDEELLAPYVHEAVYLLPIREFLPRQRVAAMRCHAARLARERGFHRIAYLDSDVLVDPDYFVRLDQLWDVRPLGSAVTLGNYPGYEIEGYLVRRWPAHDASIRTHGLGGSLAFNVDDRLGQVAERGVPVGRSWDSHFSRVVAMEHVVTSDTSYVRHLGRHDGLCVEGAPGLDWHRFTPFLSTI